MDKAVNIRDILKRVYKRRKFIMTSVLIVTIVTAIVSLLFPNYYESKTTFYAASTDIAKPEFLFGESNRDMEFYGTGEDIDRLFTVAQSRQMYRFLIDSFDLRERYKITSDKPRARERLYEKVDDYYKVTKTKFDAIELSFEDKDAEFAALVANAAREKLDQLLIEIIRRKQINQSRTLSRSLESNRNTLRNIVDTINDLRAKYNIIDHQLQSEMLATMITETEASLTRESAKLDALKGTSVKRDTIEFIRANVKGLETALKQLTESDSLGQGRVSSFNMGRMKVEELEGRFYAARINIAKDMERLKKINSLIDAELSFIHLIESAQVPLIKSRPKRSLYVITAFLISLFMSVVFVLIQHSFQTFDWKSITDDRTA